MIERVCTHGESVSIFCPDCWMAGRIEGPRLGEALRPMPRHDFSRGSDGLCSFMVFLKFGFVTRCSKPEADDIHKAAE